jgi:DNA-binding response OmpR family regulator
VVLDVMLPGVDGFEVCYRLRARATPESPMPAVLMLTAKSQESDRTMSKHVGADAYLAKPATPQELLNLVESLLAERYAA